MATKPDALKMLAEDIAGFTHDPLGYAVYAFPWGEKGSALEEASGPRDWQCEQMEDIRDHLSNPETRFTPYRDATASGHGIGKSAEIGMIVAWAMDTCDDCRVVVTANTEPQIRTKLWPEIVKWRNLSITKDWWKVTKTGIFSVIGGHEESWRADAVTWSEHNTEAFAGLHNKGKRIVVITDESSNIADKVWEVIEGALTDEETEILWLVYGNPTRNTGRFRECFGKHRALWKTRQIDSRTVEGTNTPYLQSIIDTYGEDSDIAKVRVLGQFPSASSMQFISSALVDAARHRDVFSDACEPLMMGVDVARFGDDRTTIYFRRGKDARSIPPIKLTGIDTMTLAARIAEEHRHHRALMICVDEGGIGAGVVDRLRQMQLPVVGVQFGSKPLGAVKLGEGVRIANRRAEMWAIMREWLGTAMIPDDQELNDDLIGVEYSFNARDEILLEKKEHMKARGLASPDDGDGLALTFAVPAYPAVDDESAFDEFDDSGRSEVAGY
jgi:hypothetical protein